MPHIISGEWLANFDSKQDVTRYRIGYTCRVTGGWSGGVHALVTGEVMDAIVTEQKKINPGQTLDLGLLMWCGDKETVLYVADGLDPQHFTPDEDGLYAVPSWSWDTVNADQCDTVIGAEEPEEEGGKSAVEIPGRLIADYENGAIIKWTFVPHAGDAGYFGPAAELIEGDEHLNVEDSAGAFWTAVQHGFDDDGSTFHVAWEE
jgi:hypothetical protein